VLIIVIIFLGILGGKKGGDKPTQQTKPNHQSHNHQENQSRPGNGIEIEANILLQFK
jgi:hypothetical protein